MKKKVVFTKLYTKSGDSGKSNLIGGQRLAKHHPIFQTLGDLDELNSILGIATLHASSSTKQELQLIQHQLLSIGAIIAGSNKPKLTESHITHLEKRIDFYQSQFDDKWHKSFLLPGGTKLAAHLDLARAICRRSERSYSKLLSQHPDLIIENCKSKIGKFLNRLSDYLFSLRCHANLQAHQSETKFSPSIK